MPQPQVSPIAVHEDALVHRLAKETNTSEQDARRAYEHERDQLAPSARVKTYLPILAARHARDRLLKTGT
jgi:hypothetical protein